MGVKSICGVILSSEQPKKLADFYALALGLDFEEESHGDLKLHYGVDIGAVHFGIHPPENLDNSATGHAATTIAFNINDFAATDERLKKMGSTQITAPHDEGFGQVATYKDPEGNAFEIVELDYEFNNH